jgi:DNA phosphorothioation-associated putative methyltransferase
MILQPHKTAIKRNKPSRIAKYIVETIIPETGFKSILDYGCGKGDDCNYYFSNDLLTSGYDPYYIPHLNNEFRYDIVALTYVLNVIDNEQDRILTFKKALDKVKPGGIFVVTVRSDKSIFYQASTKSWKFHNDGFITSESKGTFQKGFSIQDLMSYANYFNFTNVESIFDDDCVSILLRC